MEEYFQFMKKITERDHASPVPEDEIDADNAWYLPHFGVYHPKKQQIRVVFDSSAKYNGVSLNDALLQGPDQMNSLLGILLRFRREQTAVMGDVEQMFHSFHVNKEHRDYLRFFWFKDNDPTKPVIQYRMNVHLFGNVSSPAIATFGLRKIAEDGVSTYGEDMKEFIDKNFYVDDGLTSAPDAQKAISLINRTRDLLATRNVNFHKIVSNDEEVMTALPNEVRAKDLQSLDFNQDTLPTQRSLGIMWTLEADAFTFEVDLKEKPFSRRGVLAIVNSIYDPLGILAPVSIEGKLILRGLVAETKGRNSSNLGWDETLPENTCPDGPAGTTTSTTSQRYSYSDATLHPPSDQ
ncbi:uncharacterized protein [Ptychodera flava]|uniref:uncharacterized protein n=1 Tax=Ptychodera flava TaxID=63121 RepID=UPI00396A0982